MSDSSLNKILFEIKNCKEELKNLILASEARLQLKVEELNSRILYIEEENTILKNKVEYLERETKRKNIIIFGLDKEPEEININFVCTEIKKLLDVTIEQSDISDVYPLGRNRNSPLKIEFFSKAKKQVVLDNCRKLKGTGVVISHDLTYKQREERKTLKAHQDKQRTLGKKSYIRGNKLIVEDQKFSIEELEGLEVEEVECIQKASSTPATPTQVLIKEPESETDEHNKKEKTPIVNRHIVRKTLRSTSISNQGRSKQKGVSN